MRSDIIFVLLGLILLISDTTTVFAQTKDKKLEEVNGLSVGTPAPDFKAVSLDEQIFSLHNELRHKRIVLIFYRGQWCPVCNRHLKAIQDSLYLIDNLGAKVVAVSPERTKRAERTRNKTNASFPLIYDKDYIITKLYDVAFIPNEVSVFKYNAIGAHLKSAHDNTKILLPVPATFIIDRDRKILWRQFDRNYKHRASVIEIVSFLKSL